MNCQKAPEYLPKGKGETDSGRFLETHATYWEPRIRTYGFQTFTTLCLLDVTVPLSAMAGLGLALVRAGEDGFGFHLAFSRASSGEVMEISLLVSLETEKAIGSRLETLLPEGVTFRRTFPTELVFFHGPHFGDRYGIFLATARALEAKGIAMHAYSCSGSCIHIVLPEGKSGEAVQALSGTFVIPRQTGRNW